jgi:hypothetical protein
MEILETRRDGSLLCVLSPAETAKLKDDVPPRRKWFVKGITYLQGRPDAQHVFQYVIHAATREEAELEGGRRAIAERGSRGMLQDVGARDVTGKTKGLFDWR